MPDGVTFWDSVVISGQWSWNGRGNIDYVNINGTQTQDSVSFSVNITGKNSPLSITCRGGNKNATGNSFSWSSLIVTYTYTRYVNISTGTVEHGTITVYPNGSVEEGSTITITVTPDPGYEVTGIFVNGSVISGTTFAANNDSVVTATIIEIQEKIFYKVGSQWVGALEVYKKINGTWIKQTDLKTIFNGTTQFNRGN